MQTILEALYAGQISFDSAYYEQDSAFVKAARKKHDSFEALSKTLDAPTQNLFEQYCDARSDMEHITRYSTFTNALKFGILLMTELLHDTRSGHNTSP